MHVRAWEAVASVSMTVFAFALLVATCMQGFPDIRAQTHATNQRSCRAGIAVGRHC